MYLYNLRALIAGDPRFDTRRPPPLPPLTYVSSNPPLGPWSPALGLIRRQSLRPWTQIFNWKCRYLTYRLETMQQCAIRIVSSPIHPQNHCCREDSVSIALWALKSREYTFRRAAGNAGDDSQCYVDAERAYSILSSRHIDREDPDITAPVYKHSTHAVASSPINSWGTETLKWRRGVSAY